MERKDNDATRLLPTNNGDSSQAENGLVDRVKSVRPSGGRRNRRRRGSSTARRRRRGRSFAGSGSDIAAGRGGRGGRGRSGRCAGRGVRSRSGRRFGAPGGGGLGLRSPGGSRSGSGGLGLGSLGGGDLLTSAVVGTVVEPPASGDNTGTQVSEVLEETLREVKTVVGASHTLQGRQDVRLCFIAT